MLFRSDKGAPADELGPRRRLVGLVFGLLAPTLLSLVLHLTKDLHGLPIESMSLMVVVVATVTVNSQPVILSQPTDFVVNPAGTATFSVTANGPAAAAAFARAISSCA